MSGEIVFPTTQERIVSALRWGGYASFVPCVIESPWERMTPPAAGFPISICFTGLPRHRDGDTQSYVVSSYWFAPSTYHEDDEFREMTYRSRATNSYRVVLRYAKKQRCWEGEKLHDDEVLISASGPEMVHFIVQLTMPGIDPDEPSEPLLTRLETASAGIWIFKPDHPRTDTLK